MGTPESTKYNLRSKYGLVVKDPNADIRSLKDAILKLDKDRCEIGRGLEALKREVKYLENHRKGGGTEAALEERRADIARSEVLLKDVEQCIRDGKAALAATGSAAKNAPEQ